MPMMPVLGLLVLQVAALAGLAVGRRLAVTPLVLAIIPAALLGGPAAAAFAALAVAGAAAGVHLRGVLEQVYPRS